MKLLMLQHLLKSNLNSKNFYFDKFSNVKNFQTVSQCALVGMFTLRRVVAFYMDLPSFSLSSVHVLRITRIICILSEFSLHSAKSELAQLCFLIIHLLLYHSHGGNCTKQIAACYLFSNIIILTTSCFRFHSFPSLPIMERVEHVFHAVILEFVNDSTRW